jgi:hypothetical protein
MPLYPQNATSQGACPTPYFFVVFTLDSHLSLSRSLGARHAVKHILRYIKHTLQCGFFYEAKSQLQVHGHTNVD